MIELKRTIGSDYKIDLEDIHKVKSALNKIGYYEVPDYGMTPYPDERLFGSIKDFQKNENLKIDGVMKPNGETIQALNKRLVDDLPEVKSPTMRCTECGGPHGGSKGDLCPSCDLKS